MKQKIPMYTFHMQNVDSLAFVHDKLSFRHTVDERNPAITTWD